MKCVQIHASNFSKQSRAAYYKLFGVLVTRLLSEANPNFSIDSGFHFSIHSTLKETFHCELKCLQYLDLPHNFDAVSSG